MYYQTTNVAFVKGLKNLSAWLDKGAGFADSKKFDFGVLLNSRLAPDQFPLMKQIQIACDTAKLCAARLSGKTAPSHPDDEKTLQEAKARIASTIAFLETITEKDYADAATKKITTPRWENKWLTGDEYVQHHAIPNFYFHSTTAYAILRHNGVEVGKGDFLGQLPFKS